MNLTGSELRPSNSLNQSMTSLDSIAFKASKSKDDGIRIIINGQDFIEILREIELPFATREGSPRIAGAYSCLPAHRVYLPSRHFFGEPDPIYSDGKGRTYVLECECGEPGCWPMAVRIEVREKEVLWADFQQPHRQTSSKKGGWRYGALNSFTFDRQIYERALSTQK
jgi:hypothetical protein